MSLAWMKKRASKLWNGYILRSLPSQDRLNGLSLNISVSVDEKTGIQALERIHPTQPAKPGQVERVEFEYQRHGTQALMATMKWRRAK